MSTNAPAHIFACPPLVTQGVEYLLKYIWIPLNIHSCSKTHTNWATYVICNCFPWVDWSSNLQFYPFCSWRNTLLVNINITLKIQHHKKGLCNKSIFQSWGCLLQSLFITLTPNPTIVLIFWNLSFILFHLLRQLP